MTTATATTAPAAITRTTDAEDDLAAQADADEIAAAITITWTAASKGKKNGRAVSRRFDATLLDGRYIAGVAEAKSEDDLAAAAEADLARFGAAGQGPFVWAE
jgi:hypothetical protein